MIRAAALALALALGACATNGGSFCDLAEPIRLTPEAVDTMTLDEVRDAVEHNRIGAAQVRLESLMSEPLTTIGIELPHVVAGAAGGIVRAVIRPGQSVVQAMTTTMVGVLCAVYGTPLAERYGLGTPTWP